jgi:hypothetical protein
VTRWRNASIRVRLTSWYSIALALMLVIYASATFLAVQHEFYEQFDDQLHDDFEAAESQLLANGDGRIVGADRHADPDAEEHAIEVWSVTGEVLSRSEGSPTLPALVPAAVGNGYRYQSVDVAGHRWRTLTSVAMVGNRSVLLRVARSEDRRPAALEQQEECNRACAHTDTSEDAEQHAADRCVLVPAIRQVKGDQIQSDCRHSAAFDGQAPQAVADSVRRQFREDLMQSVKDGCGDRVG